ncbi:hypothetical protein [Pseudogulbenkiania ferrooxidans]|uniref:EAL domain-containing protein n=1 Tax=Pseudogulbenkiania ferrooxidans 2002 TaxID=279714 RepID=B9Z5N0_9NEIS|nr:hypothetical protein [Pseudogulbenkiania ferrooxidans]EEG07877.1 hypothetical protein FuraDRAFT_2665 [Pseudogulbenkiania ferrooxidans 2002]
MSKLLTFFTERVHSLYFSGFPIHLSEQGEFFGTFIKHRLASRFQPQQDGSAVAMTQCLSPAGHTIEIERLLGLCQASQSPLVLDRFVRVIHLLNYLRLDCPWHTLYLPVSLTLVAGVEAEHGKVFRDILNRLGLEHRFGILLPEALQQQPERLAAIGGNYRRHGFATALAGVDGQLLPLGG